MPQEYSCWCILCTTKKKQNKNESIEKKRNIYQKKNLGGDFNTKLEIENKKRKGVPLREWKNTTKHAKQSDTM